MSLEFYSSERQHRARTQLREIILDIFIFAIFVLQNVTSSPPHPTPATPAASHLEAFLSTISPSKFVFFAHFLEEIVSTLFYLSRYLPPLRHFVSSLLRKRRRIFRYDRFNADRVEGHCIIHRWSTVWGLIDLIWGASGDICDVI